MKSVKFGVLIATLVASLGVFLDWISVSGQLPRAIGQGLPTSGMDNGGPIFLFFLAMPLIGAAIGIARRFGRGLAALALVGSLLASFLALIKYADIDEAAQELAKLGGSATVSAAPGYWLVVCGAFAAAGASLLAVVKPEPKPLAGA